MTKTILETTERYLNYLNKNNCNYNYLNLIGFFTRIVLRFIKKVFKFFGRCDNNCNIIK